MNKNTEIVKVKWYGPYEIDSAIGRFQENEDFGLYMITRQWASHSERIVYIGRTYRQTFSRRLSRHKRWLPKLRGNIRVRIGYLLEQRSSFQRLADVEKLLILRYDPEYNQSSTRTYSGRYLHVRNLGRKGPLDKEIDMDELEHRPEYEIS